MGLCIFSDFRNYAQHCELPIGGFNVLHSREGIKFKITHDAAKLVTDYRGWRHSGLSETHGTLDLIELLDQYYRCLISDYAGFVAQTFFPNLKTAAIFYALLTQEAVQDQSDCKMVFAFPPESQTGDPTKQVISLEMIFVPNDLYSELGITVKTDV